MRKGLLLIAFVACLAAAAPAADVVGLVSTVSGTVQIIRPGVPAPYPARVADLIAAGDRLVTGRNSDASFIFCPASKAGKVAADSDVEFQAKTFVAKKGKLTEERPLPSCKLPTTLTLAYASQQQAGMPRLRGAPLALKSPAQTQVASVTPQFNWTAVDSAKHYDIKLMDREERILWKQRVTSTQVIYPADAKPMAWGQKYWWRVTASDGEETINEATSYFQVLPVDQADAVRSAEATLRKTIQENPADNGPRFLLAFLYEENGILHEAALVYDELAQRMGPQDWVRSRRDELQVKLGWNAIGR